LSRQDSGNRTTIPDGAQPAGLRARVQLAGAEKSTIETDRVVHAYEGKTARQIVNAPNSAQKNPCQRL